jgi:transcriptional regulator with XRE-family HTH domain
MLSNVSMEAPSMDSSRSRRIRPLGDLSPDVTPARAAVAAELRRGRGNVQLSLEELARRVYSSKATVSRWLAGQSLPSRKQASDWARMCGTDEAIMLQLLANAVEADNRADPLAESSAAESAGDTVIASPPRDNSTADTTPRKERHLSKATLVIIGIAVVVAVTVGLTWPIITQRHAAPCNAAYPLVLQIPPQTGAHVGVTVEAVCDVPADRTYLVIEKIPDVDPTNPHPAYYVKATIPHLTTSQTSSKEFILKEPVGTRAEFLVISVDNGGLRALGQNQVVDHGILFLPSGTIQASPIVWHTKGWE